jgi:transposase IS166 family protein
VSAAYPPSVPRPTTFSEAEKIIEQLQQKLQFSELRVLVLEEQLRQRRIEKYGAGSEKLSNLQLEMLEQEPGVSQAEVQAESERPGIEGNAVEVAGYRRQRRTHPGNVGVNVSRVG